MPLSDLPNEIILEIADHLRDKAMNALARTSYGTYNLLNGYLYRRDVTRQAGGSSLKWGVLNDNEGTIKHATAAGHYLDPLPLCYRKALEVAIRRR